MRRRRGGAVLLALVGLLPAGCGGAGGAGPEKTATRFATAWTEARCADAMTHVAAPDKNWTATCEATFRFGIKCDETQAGDPAATDCGPGTTIEVRKTEITGDQRRDDTAELAVLVSYTQGRNTKESRTLNVRLREQAGRWKVVEVG